MTTTTTTSTSATLLLVLLFLTTQSTNSQTWETSNDPDNLCSNSYTGYKATLDCRGYVYCSDGYLMGGDQIPCWPNQLFDESTGSCTSWQSVTEKLGDSLAVKCPDFDGSMMMPEDTDGNANPQLFFCGTSTFNAKNVCEPCPGGSRLECSDPTHNCFAGVTGCPVSSSVDSTPSEPEPVPNPPPETPQPVTPQPVTPPPILEPVPNPPLETPEPTPSPSVSIELANPVHVSNDASDAGDLTDDLYLHGSLRSSYYCGYSWDLVTKTCNMAHPCPSGLNEECPMSQFCFPDTPCHELQTPPPSPPPTPKPTTIDQAKYYCGANWEWVINNCDIAIPCPSGDAMGVCPEGQDCIADTPCDRFDIVGPNSQKPTPLPTRNPTFPPVEGDDPANRFCGHNWVDVTENCLTAIPCPGGVAKDVCPWEMNCIAETPCNDQVYLDWLKDKQAKQAAEAEANDVAPTTVATDEEGNVFCTENSDCDVGLLCNKGYCGQCLDDGTGCSVDQVCAYASCGAVQEYGPKTCFTMSDMDGLCQSLFGDNRAICVLDVMQCEVPSVDTEVFESEDTEATEVATEPETGSFGEGEGAMYENPEGNDFFCGSDYYAIKALCLSSKPCPGGFASGVCASDEGCFSVIECLAEYENSVYTGNINPSPVTSVPTSIPNQIASPTASPSVSLSDVVVSSSTPTVQQVVQSSSAPVTSSPSSQTDPSSSDEPTNVPVSATPTLPLATAPPVPNTNFCGISWSSHTEDCENAKPCPRGDECAAGETCFSGSPCASLSSDNSATESNIEHLCGTDWNTLLGTCTDATPCPKGDECADGEMCYRNFECVPPIASNSTEETDFDAENTSQSNPGLAGAFETALNGTTQVIVNGNDLADSDATTTESTVSSDSDSGDTPQSSTTTANIPTETTERSTTVATTSSDSNLLSDSDNSAQSSSSSETTVAPATASESTTTQISINGNDLTSSDASAVSTVVETDSESTVVSSSTNASGETGSQDTSTATVPPLTSTESSDTALSAPSEKAPETIVPPEEVILTHCDLCGAAGQFDYNQYVDYESSEGTNKMPCGELIWVFAKNNIYEGSTECLSTRAKYFGECCFVPPANECELCPVGKEVYLDKNILFMGDEYPCSRVNTLLSSKFESSSDTCLDAQANHQYDCCFEQCTICGNLQPNWEGSVYFSGEDIQCNEFDIMFREEGVTLDSSRCEMTRDLYADECCIQPMDEPCDICNTQVSGKQLKSGTTVTYNGESTTCLGAYTYLFSLKENASEQCASAQKELSDQCCEVPPAQQATNTDYDRAPAPVPYEVPTNAPMPTEDTLSNNWYAGSLKSSAFTVGSTVRWLSPLLAFFLIPVVNTY